MIYKGIRTGRLIKITAQDKVKTTFVHLQPHCNAGSEHCKTCKRYKTGINLETGKFNECYRRA